MKIYFKILCLAAVILLSGSCKKYLNETPDNFGTLDYAFRNRNEAENYLFTCYATLQQMADVTSNAGFTTSGEIVYPNDLTSYGIDRTGFNLLRGTQSSSNVGLDFWNGQNHGLAIFKAIRRCNIMLENIDKPVDLTAGEKVRWIAETKFLKAYYHYYLLRLYGPIPLIKTNLDVEATTEQVKIKRESIDSCFKYIVSLLNEAAPDLPSTISNKTKELGRITKAIALSVKAEVLVTAASPLFNGNPDYASLANKDGEKLFPQSIDPIKWQLAATACKDAITECETDGLKLYTFIPPANISTQLTDSLKRVLTIQNAVTEKWDINPELIWALNSTFPFQGYCTPRMTSLSVVNGFSNPSTFGVPISMQELFYTQNGVPITEDKTFDYTNRFKIQIGNDASRYYIAKNYSTVAEHFGREPRFYASIGFDGGIWFGNGKLGQNDLYHVEARGASSFAGPKDKQWLNEMGYWPKKLVNYLSVYDDGFAPVDFHMPMMRLSGLYLLYAEALNESTGPGAEAYTYIDKVRTRAGLPGVQYAWTNFSSNSTKFTTKDGLRQIIHQERRIELCFEAQSGWDLRRWKELQAVLSVPLQGWNIYQSEPGNYYRPTTVLLPIFGLKNYLWPIRSDDLLIDPNLVQNTYW